ncbi:hypothetical protein C8R44DRAFT_923196 [Mycena epipterygia]|nr:hypothetical protein C8R44DRAFT_923196 [Mycena epipterygia]
MALKEQHPRNRKPNVGLKRGQDFLEKKNPEEALPFLIKAMDKPHHLDVYSSISEMLPQDMAIKFLEYTELKYVRSCASTVTCEYGAPDFWGIYGTRPYMRVLRTLMHTYVNAKHYATNIEIIRICSSDNMGVRASTGPLLLHAGRAADALYFMQPWVESGGMPPGSGIDFVAPRRTPMSNVLYQQVAEWTDLRMIYSAALAALTLDGDSELARQYLHIAAQFPSVLIKVIGKFKERAEGGFAVEGDTHPVRACNGIEDARDHLWLAQDLWMRDDAWNWVNSDPVVKAHVLRECGDPACKRKEERVGQWQKCADCKKEWYCMRNCQKAHWPHHKDACKEEQESVRSMRY